MGFFKTAAACALGTGLAIHAPAIYKVALRLSKFEVKVRKKHADPDDQSDK